MAREAGCPIAGGLPVPRQRAGLDADSADSGVLAAALAGPRGPGLYSAPVSAAVSAPVSVGLLASGCGDLSDAARKADAEADAAEKSAGDTLSPQIKALAEANLTDSGQAVLGHFPGYITKANAKGASYFDIGDAWNALTPEERWAANTHFLDVVADRGNQVLLSLPKTEIRPGSYLAQEVQYLTSKKGYVWVNQWSLRPPP